MTSESTEVGRFRGGYESTGVEGGMIIKDLLASFRKTAIRRGRAEIFPEAPRLFEPGRRGSRLSQDQRL